MEHPITPPQELLQQWAVEYWGNPGESIGEGEKHIAIQAARWGADQELEACCEWLDDDDDRATLRAARRPKPPSLKQQASDSLDEVVKCLKMLVPGASVDGVHIETIRRALESLPDTEI